jgi:sec-independent protein translocase protein TatA
MHMFDIGAPELVIVLVIVLIVFGVGRLPEIGGALGKSIREFRQASREDVSVTEKDAAQPAPPPVESKAAGTAEAR